jgi:glycosyltransferase involved in cell wall biosynthesis
MNASLQIAIVTETYVPEINGVAKTIHRLVEKLAHRGHRVRLVRPRLARDEQPRRGEIEETFAPAVKIPVYRSLHMGLPAGRLLVGSWRRYRPDLVHVATEGLLGLSATRAARALGLPVVSGFHTDFVAFAPHYRLGWLAPLVGSYLRRLHNATDCTLVPTATLSRRLVAEGYENVAVVGRGIDEGLFSPLERDDELRRQWGAGKDDVVALHVGRLAPEKNIDLVMQSFEAMHARVPNLKAVVVGDGPLLECCRARYKDVVFAGALRGRELARHFASGDVFVFPSLVETFGNVVLEAMASQLAIVAFDHAAAHEHLRHDDSAFLARCDRPDEFVRLAAELAASPERIARFRKRARRASEACTWDAVTASLVSAYERVLAGRTLVVERGNVGGRITTPTMGTTVTRTPAVARAAF